MSKKNKNSGWKKFGIAVLVSSGNYINDVISIINPKTMQMVNVYNPYPKVSTITFN